MKQMRNLKVMQHSSLPIRQHFLMEKRRYWTALEAWIQTPAFQIVRLQRKKPGQMGKKRGRLRQKKSKPSLRLSGSLRPSAMQIHRKGMTVTLPAQAEQEPLPIRRNMTREEAWPFLSVTRSHPTCAGHTLWQPTWKSLSCGLEQDCLIFPRSILPISLPTDRTILLEIPRMTGTKFCIPTGMAATRRQQQFSLAPGAVWHWNPRCLMRQMRTTPWIPMRFHLPVWHTKPLHTWKMPHFPPTLWQRSKT